MVQNGKLDKISGDVCSWTGTFMLRHYLEMDEL